MSNEGVAGKYGLATEPTPEVEEDITPGGLTRTEAVLTAICTLALATGFFGGFFGMTEPVRTIFYIIAYLSGGFFGTIEGLKALRRFELNVDFLMVLAAVGAASIGEWVEGATLLFLFSLSNTLQAYALDRSRHAIRALMDLRPAEATLRHPDGTDEVVPLEVLKIGDLILVKPGERFAVDGEVVSGASSVDQAAITGESMPVAKEVGAIVFAGTVNGKGALEVRMTKAVEDTTLAKIIQLVEQAQSSKAPTQRFLDEFEPKYAMGVVAMVILAILIPYFLLRQPFDEVFYRAMTLLVVASPCALVISTPASILSAIANAARNGILVKGGAYLEQLASVEAIAFDKTGTLTMGRPSVVDIVVPQELLGDAWFESEFFSRLEPSGPCTPDRCAPEELLQLAASVERLSEHPLGDAIVKAAQAQSIPFVEADNLQSITGQGVIAYVKGAEIRIGNQRLFDTAGQLWPEPLRARARDLEAQGKTVIGVSRDNHPLGLIALADTVRPDAKATIAALRALGIRRIIMLTGDTHRVAAVVAEELGIDEVHGDLLPEQKVEVIRRLTQQASVAMVGDGVNDAPALATSNVGIAMGGAGTDVALETADMVLMGDDLTRLPYAIELSRRARQIVWQNIAFSMSVIVFLIAGVFLVRLPLPLGVVGHEGSTLVVVANGLRLLRSSGGLLKRN
ncbi:MAG: heavy metal translocating P-type ATPase [Ardenticatenales bacterium]|nr:heavy metal translocating P-type ATPase [Ardenticatenales bacterium]